MATARAFWGMGTQATVGNPISLYFGDFNTLQIYFVNNFPTDAGVVFATGSIYSAGLITDQNGNLFVANAPSGNILKITSGGTITTVATGFTFPEDIAVDVSGNLYIVDNNGNVYLNNPSTPYASGLGIVSVCCGLSNGIFGLTANGIVYQLFSGSHTTIYGGGLSSCVYIRAGLPTNGNLYIASNYYPYYLYKLTYAGVLSTLATAVAYIIRGLAVDKNENAYVFSTNGINQVKPDGSIYVSTVGNGAGPGLSMTKSIVF